MRIFGFILVLMVGLCLSNQVVAQDGGSSQKEFVYKPNVILFMLHVSTNQIEGLRRRGMTAQIKEVEDGDRETNLSIIKDFSLNFKFCPVYFFYDTQLNAVLKHDWDNVTFYDDEHMTSAKKIEANSFGNYFIGEVNYPPSPNYPEIKDGQVNSATNNDEVEYANTRDYGILLYDDTFKLLPAKLQFTNVSLRRKGNVFNASSMKYVFSGTEKFEKKLISYYAEK